MHMAPYKLTMFIICVYCLIYYFINSLNIIAQYLAEWKEKVYNLLMISKYRYRDLSEIKELLKNL